MYVYEMKPIIIRSLVSPPLLFRLLRPNNLPHKPISSVLIEQERANRVHFLFIK